LPKWPRCDFAASWPKQRRRRVEMKPETRNKR
jgi:hypothetical protein